MLRVLVLCLVTGLALAACGGHDKAGGDAAGGGATIKDRDARRLAAHARGVRRRASQRLAGAGTRVTVRTGYRSQDGDPEGATIADVRSGKVPFALIYARAFDDLGVDAFAPMLAPLAIDSLATQQRVIAAGIADRALPALGKLGVVGVAVVPGTLRHPLGLTRPLLRPADFDGAYIGVRAVGAGEAHVRVARRDRRAGRSAIGPPASTASRPTSEGSSRGGSTSALPRSPPTSRCGRASASWWRTRRPGRR